VADPTCPKCGSNAICGVSDGDSVGYWSCMECKHEWAREGYYAELARKNIDRWRQQEGKR